MAVAIRQQANVAKEKASAPFQGAQPTVQEAALRLDTARPEDILHAIAVTLTSSQLPGLQLTKPSTSAAVQASSNDPRRVAAGLTFLPPEVHAQVARALSAREIATLENLTYGPGKAPLLWEHVAAPLRAHLQGVVPTPVDVRQLLFRGLSAHALARLSVQDKKALILYLLAFATDVALFRQLVPSDRLMVAAKSKLSSTLELAIRNRQGKDLFDLDGATKTIEKLRGLATSYRAVGEARKALAEDQAAGLLLSNLEPGSAPWRSVMEKSLGTMQVLCGEALEVATERLAKYLNSGAEAQLEKSSLPGVKMMTVLAGNIDYAAKIRFVSHTRERMAEHPSSAMSALP